jgi:hypothetical protein
MVAVTVVTADQRLELMAAVAVAVPVGIVAQVAAAVPLQGLLLVETALEAEAEVVVVEEVVTLVEPAEVWKFMVKGQVAQEALRQVVMV